MSVISRISIESDNFLKEIVGEKGIMEMDVMNEAERLAKLGDWIRKAKASEETSFINLPFRADLEGIKTLGNQLLKKFKKFVVFGIGGSSLGGQMLVETLGTEPDKHKVKFYDNVDPTSLEELSTEDWTQTAVIAISKSGNTAETLAQLLSVLPRMERMLGSSGTREHITIITENPQGALQQVGERMWLRIEQHPAVGGRYSVLSVVGLLPAYLAGVDIDGVVEGARAMAERCMEKNLRKNPGFFQGAAQYLLYKKGMGISQWMTYADRYVYLVDWFRQLWAESLGKHNESGEEVGLTPVFAKGVTDQHSQLQLYLDGPSDKQFTFITSPDLVMTGERIPMRFADLEAVKPLVGHTTGELFAAEFQGTRETLCRRGRPNRTISLQQGDAYAIGELIILLEVETVVVAELLGIDAYDQPAVEESKVHAREYLGRMRAVRNL